MLRKTLIALAAVAAVGVAAGTADARMGSGPVGNSGGTHSGPSGMQGSSGMKGSSGVQGPSSVQGPTGKSFNTQSFNTQNRVPQTTRPWSGQTWAGGDRHHHRHHRDRFFAFGFAGPYYDDYGYDSCWRLVPTYGGWQRVWVCGDYPYWGY